MKSDNQLGVVRKCVRSAEKTQVRVSLQLRGRSIRLTERNETNFIMPTDANGKKWLATKATEAGVVTLPSGLMYKVIEKGSGTQSPLAGTPIDANYEGYLIDGTKFDSSFDRGKPLSCKPNQVVGGWTEALQLMKEGDKWELYIPSELGYGEDGTPGGPIPPNAALHFIMQLVKVKA